MNLLLSDIDELNTILNCENINLIIEDNFLEVKVYYYNIHIMTLDLDISKAMVMQILLVLLKVKPSYWKCTSCKDSPNLIKFISNDIRKFGIDYIYRTIYKNNTPSRKFVLLFNIDKLDSKKKLCEIFSDYNHKKMGLALGFAPMAVNDFITKSHHNRITLNYYGITFSVEKSNYESALEYMEATYPVSEIVKKLYHKLI